MHTSKSYPRIILFTNKLATWIDEMENPDLLLDYTDLNIKYFSKYLNKYIIYFIVIYYI